MNKYYFFLQTTVEILAELTDTVKRLRESVEELKEIKLNKENQYVSNNK